MAYPDAERACADADARIELAQELLGRLQPLEGTPAEAYLLKTRRIPAEAVRACPDLRYLPSPIEGRPPVDHALVSLLRDAAGAVSGLQLEFIDIAGARAAAEPSKQTYSLRPGGVGVGLFRAGGADGEVAYLTEGYSAKALAVAALGLGPTYGGGGRGMLGCAVPPEATVVLVPDRRPPDTSPDAAAHDRDLKYAADRLLVARKTVLVAKAPECTHAGGGGCKDADDVLRQHGPVRLRELVEATDASELSLDGEGRRLAQIDDPLERDQATKAKAAELKVKVALLRDRVTHYRERKGETTRPKEELAGDEVTFSEIRPWHEPVDGAELVQDLTDYVNDHAVVPEHGALTCALWVLHCHAHNAAYHSPRLILRSPTKGCGKSTLRRTLSRLVPRPFEAVDITGPTLFRPIGQWRPTVFVDEANEISWANARDLIAVVNSGHCRDDPGVPRCVGPDLEVRMFQVWAPLCLALIGFLPSTIAERSITIEMRKKASTAAVRRLLRRDKDRVAEQLARRAARWAIDHKITLENADPDLPPTLGDRPGDNWRSLLMIADLIGVGKEARAAAVALSSGDDDGEELGIQLLADIRKIFDETKAAQLPSSTIVGKLLAMEERPWPELGRMQKPLTANAMARMLRPFKIRPSGTIRVGRGTPKGYARTAFESAWAAYSLSDTPSQPPHRHNPGAEPVSGDSQPPHASDGVADGIGPKPAAQADCGGVAVVTGSDSAHAAPGNGADPDAVVDEVVAGARCGFCGLALNGEAAEQIGARWYHSEACATEARKRAAAAPAEPPPQPRRSRIKRPSAGTGAPS